MCGHGRLHLSSALARAVGDMRDVRPRRLISIARVSDDAPAAGVRTATLNAGCRSLRFLVCFVMTPG